MSSIPVAMDQTYPPIGGYMRTDISADDLFALRQLHLSRAKLRASSRISALLAGFAMVAIVELEISGLSQNVPQALLIAFTSFACLLVVVHMIAVMISTCILPHLDSYVNLHGSITAKEAPHERLKIFIEVAWIFSTILGIALFLAVVILACWVKFWSLSQASAIAGTLIIVPALLVFAVISILLYRTLIGHKVERANQLMQRLDMGLHLLEAGDMNVRDPTTDYDGSACNVIAKSSSPC